MVVFVAIFLITTLFILYNSNSTNESYDAFKFTVYNSATKNTNLKKWAGKDGYIPIFGNKVSKNLRCCGIVKKIRISLNIQFPVCFTARQKYSI